MTTTGKNRIARKTMGPMLLSSERPRVRHSPSQIPRTEAGVIRHFQERMPYGLFVPDVP